MMAKTDANLGLEIKNCEKFMCLFPVSSCTG
jgi:hypothetical protein